MNDKKWLSIKRVMETSGRIIFGYSKKMDSTDSESVNLIVTSPPYPMIKMWDEMFCDQNPSIRKKTQVNSQLELFSTQREIFFFIYLVSQCH
ncbi:MAG: hypothetical protein U9R43_07835 [Thermodesulfobacteriota bacterium]|nr:hypothetical protein [Thermodesulfobacteriota bacterium]